MKKAITVILLLILAISSAGFEASAYDDRSNYREHDKRFGNSLIVDGVDVSSYQDDDMDWEAAKESGIDFAIMRISFTRSGSGNLESDKVFGEHFENARKAGIMCGVYVFSQALNAEEGAREAEFAISRLQKLGIGPEDLMLPVYMDYEFYNKGASRLRGLTEKDAVAAAQGFCKTVQSHGYDAGVYANSYFFSNYLNNGLGLPDNTDLWIAQYSNSINSECNYTKWQYSNMARFDVIDYGPDARVDSDYWYIDKKTEDSEINISGSTYVDYTGDPVLPDLGIYYQGKRLVKGVDYIVGGIRNIDIGAESYAYIKGIGDYEGYALVPINIEKGKYDNINLPSKVITGTNLEKTGYLVYSDTGRTTIGIIPEGTTVKELLSDIEISSDDYYTRVIDSEGNCLKNKEKVSFDNMIGVFNCKDDTLIGTIDLQTETEKGINHLRHK